MTSRININTPSSHAPLLRVNSEGNLNTAGSIGTINPIALNRNPEAPAPIPSVIRAVVAPEPPTFPQHAALLEKMRNLARFAIHNPSPDAQQIVRDALINFGHLITRYSLTIEDLEFILDAASESRSEYTKHHTPGVHERRAKLRDLLFTLTHFNQLQNFEARFDTYVNLLEALTSGIGYRAIGAAAKKDDGVKPPAGTQRLLDDFNGKNYLPSHIRVEFPHRASDDVSRSTSSVPSIEIPRGLQDPVEGGLPGAQPGASARKFGLDSYVVKAMSKNIPMRAHVSGSAPLTLAALQYIMNDGRAKGQTNEYALIQLGGIVSAVYALGDFHSIAETAAGVAHFYQLNVQMRFPNLTGQLLEEIHPKTFYALGFGFLNAMVREEALEQFTAMSEDLLDDYIEDVTPEAVIQQVLPHLDEAQQLVSDYLAPLPMDSAENKPRKKTL